MKLILLYALFASTALATDYQNDKYCWDKWDKWDRHCPSTTTKYGTVTKTSTKLCTTTKTVTLPKITKTTTKTLGSKTVTITATRSLDQLTATVTETTTAPGGTETATVSLTETLSLTETETLSLTETLGQTLTETATQTCEVITATETATLSFTETLSQILTETATQTLSFTETQSQTLTETATQTLSLTEIDTQTLILTETRSETVTATTATTESASTVTVTQTATSTASAVACPIGDPVINGGFESDLAGSWTVLTAGDAEVERVNLGGALGNVLRVHIDNANLNHPQRIIQAITVCPGASYQVSFKARRITRLGVISATLYINDTPLAGGTVSDTTFTAASPINSGIFSVTSNSVILRLEVTYSGVPGAPKEAQFDDITLTKLP